MQPEQLLDFADRILHVAEIGYPLGLAKLQPAIRRAVSGCCYAVFHSIANSYTERLYDNSNLHRSLVKKFTHTNMANVCKDVAKFQGNQQFKGIYTVDRDMKEFARIFQKLQADRYRADYDMRASSDFSSDELEIIAKDADGAISLWKKIVQTDDGQAFLQDLLLGLK